MNLTTLEIKPNRLLLDSNFDGYKLSLQEIKSIRKNLEIPVDKTFLNSSQYGLLHAKLFGLHNHLFEDKFDNFSAVYFIDKEFNIQKTYVDSLSNAIVDPITVYTIPKTRDHKAGDYNATLRFASEEYAVASDGMGGMYVLATRDKNDDDAFEILFSDNVLENGGQGFIISDALYNKESKELHILLIHIQEDIVERFVTIVNWLTLKESENRQNKGNDWGQVALRQLKTKGEVQYLHLEKNCQHIYVVSENRLEFLLNSEYPVKADNTNQSEGTKKVYQWSQNLDEITLKISLSENIQRDLVEVATEAAKIKILYNSEVILAGDLSAGIDPSLTTWTIQKDHTLEITLIKGEGSGMWTELVVGDQRGEYLVAGLGVTDRVTNQMESFTGETEATPQTGTTFNSQQVEECDFETDKNETFERISGITSTATHRIHLGSHQVLLSPYLSSEGPPALGIRHDVDVCLWKPIIEADNFTIKHEGTLLAFGYVQASKQNRKFTTCSPNLDYAVISESSGHIFIYQQNKPLLATELRQRSTGHRLKHVAQQQVFNLPNQDILGIFAGNSHFFILGESFVMALHINSGTE